MKEEKANIDELMDKAAARQQQTQAEITAATVHEANLMSPYGITFRECLASDNQPLPLAISFNMDTSGSMGIVPENLCKGDLPHLMERMTQMSSCGNQNPQLSMNGVADLRDKFPIQVGQYEGDNRFDDWLVRIQIRGGSGSERLHEAYMLALYVAARKTSCECWSRQKKGHLFITGDEMCNPILCASDVKRIFGDTIDQDLHLNQLIKEVRLKWHLSFLYVHTGWYGEEGKIIWPYWQQLLGNDAYWLDGKAKGLPEIVSAIIGINEGVFTADQVPQDLIELGCETTIVQAVAKALRVEAPKSDEEKKPTGKRRPQRM